MRGQQVHTVRRTSTVRVRAAVPAPPPGNGAKHALVARLLQAKEASGKTFSQIATEIGVTNVFCASLFYHQQMLPPARAEALAKAVPGLQAQDLAALQRAPMRRFDPELLQEPTVYRLYEAIMHGGEAIKAIVNEEFGDGIPSAIDVWCTVDKVEGRQGEARVVLTINGKFLKFCEQDVEGNVAQRSGTPPKP